MSIEPPQKKRKLNAGIINQFNGKFDALSAQQITTLNELKNQNFFNQYCISLGFNEENIPRLIQTLETQNKILNDLNDGSNREEEKDPFCYIISNKPPHFLPHHLKSIWPRTKYDNIPNQVVSKRRILISIHLENSDLPRKVIDNEWITRKTFLRQINQFEKTIENGHIQRTEAKQPLENHVNALSVSKDTNKSKKFDNILIDLTETKSLCAILNTQINVLEHTINDHVINKLKIAVLNDGKIEPKTKTINIPNQNGAETVIIAPTLYKDYCELIDRVKAIRDKCKSTLDAVVNIDFATHRLCNGETVDFRLKRARERKKKKMNKRKLKSKTQNQSQ